MYSILVLVDQFLEEVLAEISGLVFPDQCQVSFKLIFSCNEFDCSMSKFIVVSL